MTYPAMKRDVRWGVVLAGGDGNRLRTLTRLLSGDDRPKQFCAISGQRTLLADTALRVGRVVDPDRIVYVVTRKHRFYYARDLWGVRRTRLIEQPENRGTTAAIAAAVRRVSVLASDGLVACFPADHHYANEDALQRAVEEAFAAAASHPRRLVLIGAAATSAETAFGWIEPGASLGAPTRRRSPAAPCLVRSFVEKPSADAAAELYGRGCLWNTFITVGRVEAFLSLFRAFAPETLDVMQTFRWDDPEAFPLYSALPASDFSRDVLSRCPERLAVVTLHNSGWADLGQPARALDVMAQHSFRRPNLRLAAS